MAAILKNYSLSPLTLVDLNITIPAEGTFDLTTLDIANIRDSDELVLAVAFEDLVLNNGQRDLTRDEAEVLLFGTFILRNDDPIEDVIIDDIGLTVYANDYYDLSAADDADVRGSSQLLDAVSNELLTLNNGIFDIPTAEAIRMIFSIVKTIPHISNHPYNKNNPHETTAVHVGNTTAQWNADQLQSIDITTTAPANSQVLAFNDSTNKLEFVDRSLVTHHHDSRYYTESEVDDLLTNMGTVNRIEEDNIEKATGINSLNFTGEVTVTDSGNGEAEVNIPDMRTLSNVEENGSLIVNDATTINFTGGVNVIDSGNNEVEVNVYPYDTSFSQLDAIQVRRTTSFEFPNNWTDITLDITDIETNSTVLDHDDATETEKIFIKADGLYLINHTAILSSDCSDYQYTRILKNNTEEIPGSLIGLKGKEMMIGRQCIATLSTGDYITLQGKHAEGSTDNSEGDVVVLVIKLDGIKGDRGIPGGTTVDIQKDDIAIAVDVDEINFEGNVVVTDEGAGKVTVSLNPNDGLESHDIHFTYSSNDKPYYKFKSSHGSGGENWKEMSPFIFRGSNITGTPSYIKIVYGTKESNANAALRLYDITNNKVIAYFDDLETSHSSDLEVAETTVITNIPTGESLFAIQGLVDTGYFYLYSFHIFFGGQ